MPPLDRYPIHVVEAALTSLGYHCDSDGSGMLFFVNARPAQLITLDPWEQQVYWTDLEGELRSAGVDIETFTTLADVAYAKTEQSRP